MMENLRTLKGGGGESQTCFPGRYKTFTFPVIKVLSPTARWGEREVQTPKEQEDDVKLPIPG